MYRSYTEDHAVVNQVDDRDRVLKWLANVKDSRRRVVEYHAEARRCVAVVAVIIVSPAVEQRTHRPNWRKTVNGLPGVSLNDAAVGNDDGKDRSPGAVRRPAAKGCADSASIERARENLRRQTRSEVPREDAAGLRVRRSGQRNPGRV